MRLRLFFVRNQLKFKDPELQAFGLRLSRLQDDNQGKAILALMQELKITVKEDNEPITSLWKSLQKQYPLLPCLYNEMGSVNLDAEIVRYLNA